MQREFGDGLSDEEAKWRLTEYGENRMPESAARSSWRLALEIIREPMFLLLISCGMLYLIIGDIEEALLLLGFVLLTMFISFSQQRKTDKAIEALNVLSAPTATVMRHGEEHRIQSVDIVPGDTLVLREGDRVCADAVLLRGDRLSVDESLLTGESVPVVKVPNSMYLDSAQKDSNAMVFTGTLVVGGQGTALVTATGEDTELGKIGSSLLNIQPEHTLLEQETKQMVRVLASLGIFLCLIATVVSSLLQHNFTAGLLIGLTLAMAVIPEELPIVFTLFLTLGAWRMSRHNVLTRRPPVIETLGTATVLCTDKTGTLTLNQMSVAYLVAGDNVIPMDGSGLSRQSLELIEYASLASSTTPNDPMDKAIQRLAETSHIGPSQRMNWTLTKVYPLTSQCLAVGQVWQTAGVMFVACKGAPETVAGMCRLSEQEKGKMSRQVSELANDGIRVLAVAYAQMQIDEGLSTRGESQGYGLNQSSLVHGLNCVYDSIDAYQFHWVGLVGFVDPIRPTVPAAVRQSESAGLRVVMITGDHPVTARSIARKIGLEQTEHVLTGDQIDQLSDRQLSEAVRNVDVFARVVPDHKLRLVNAFKDAGEIVAMTGDGVNDAPALKAAHIGIAMGMRGTDVAREAASIVLLDDEFATIVTALRMGRRIYDNLRKAFMYVLAIHIPIIGLSLLPVLFQLPPVLFPAHVVFMELMIDPACSIAFEAEHPEDDILQRLPRDRRKRLFRPAVLGFAAMQGVSSLIASAAVLSLSLWGGLSADTTRGLTFTTLIASNVSLIFANRSWSQTTFHSLRNRNPAVWWIVGAAAVLLVGVNYVPFLQTLFQIRSTSVVWFLAAVLLGLVSAFWVDWIKPALRQS